MPQELYDIKLDMHITPETAARLAEACAFHPGLELVTRELGKYPLPPKAQASPGSLGPLVHQVLQRYADAEFESITSEELTMLQAGSGYATTLSAERMSALVTFIKEVRRACYDVTGEVLPPTLVPSISPAIRIVGGA